MSGAGGATSGGGRVGWAGGAGGSVAMSGQRGPAQEGPFSSIVLPDGSLT